MKQVMLSKDFGLKARFNEAMYRTKTLQYELPAFVVSYPRSGSNFLQSVLSASCGIHSRSIYGKYNIWPLCKPLTDPQSVILSLKSHALSPEYLQDEINRFLPHIKKPSKIILLKRDPRDVMISFYEYTQYKREAKIPQEDFLENVAFFYASTIDSKFKRRLEYAPLSICDAYKKHVNSWFGELPKDLDLFTVAFEELRENPEESFGSIFEFLNLDCKLAEESLNKQVSVYSKENRPRGKSFGWRDQQDKYKTIIDDTNRLLEKEIRMLGYEL